ncbi:hypothetical protein B0H14DRAFT_1479114 [Mycena olivaceomarginata]|nr:hypothetical protein B0H14DRAFT_1479114 [Mycena olivaceomarginata]
MHLNYTTPVQPLAASPLPRSSRPANPTPPRSLPCCLARSRRRSRRRPAPRHVCALPPPLRLTAPACAHRCAAYRTLRCHTCPAHPRRSPRFRIALACSSHPVSISPMALPAHPAARVSPGTAPAPLPRGYACPRLLSGCSSLLRVLATHPPMPPPSVPHIIHTAYAPLHSTPTRHCSPESHSSHNPNTSHSARALARATSPPSARACPCVPVRPHIPNHPRAHAPSLTPAPRVRCPRYARPTPMHGARARTSQSRIHFPQPRTTLSPRS